MSEGFSSAGFARCSFHMQLPPAGGLRAPHLLAVAPRATAAVRRVHLRPQWAGPRAPFRHTWEGVINVDQFRWMVRRDMQDQLELARRELGARHVRAVGMFDDEMRVFCPSPASFMGYEPKDPRTNWQVVDYVIDSLLDRGLNPMFTTSFVPKAMASGSTTIFSTHASTTPPRDWRQWENLVRDAVAHAVDRYSLPVVRQWYFEVWNEPNLKGWFWDGSQAEFHRLWQITHHAIKSVDASLRVGGPSTAHAAWIEALLDFGQEHDCRPDYLITHIYNNDSPTGEALAPFDGAQVEKNSKSPDSAMEVMRELRERISDAGFKGELHWNEWGRSFHAVDHRREQPSEAAFIARLMAEVSQEADVFAYWCLSDIYDQVGYGRETFHGGYGLLNLNGLRKPAYHAFQLLAKLGHERIAVAGDGLDSFCNTIVTTSARTAHVLVYAYDHADQPARSSLEVTVELPPGARTGQLYRIDSVENNVVAKWRELGAPDYLSRAQTAELKAGNQLRPCPAAVFIEGAENRAQARFSMEAPGVALLEITLADA
jgi:xylan 1,4-beta-xylosidase